MTNISLKSADQMKKAITKILTKIGRFDEFQRNEEFHIKIENEPYMPLVIEKHHDRVMIIHYYEQNGDLLSDPDVEFLIRDEKWFPVGMQDSFGYSRSLIIDSETGTIKVYSNKYSSILSFTNMWARNINQQNF